MRNERTAEIKATLTGLGTVESELYTNKEIVDKLVELQAALSKGVFEKTHAEHMRERDILIHFEALAKEYGLEESETFLRFKNNMNELGYTIGTFIKGMNGERIARRALKLLSFEKNVRILYNVELEDDDAQAEYDAIVVAPYGLFVVEVKNWGASMIISENGLLQNEGGNGVVYDLPGRMSVKEALLRTYLGEMFPDKYTGMLLLSNERARLVDEYKKIPVSFGGGISYEIKSFSKDGCFLSEKQINAIANKILEYHKEQRAPSPVHCEEIIEDYANLMSQIEVLASGEQIEDDEPVAMAAEKNESPVVRFFKTINWGKVGIKVASVAAVAIPGTIAIISGLKNKGDCI